MRKFVCCGIWALFLLISGCRHQAAYSERELKNARLNTTSFVEQCRGTPAEFAANSRLGMEEAAMIVKGGISDKEYAAAVKRLSKCYEEASRGLEWQAPITKADIPELEAPPVIDGEIDEQEWRGALLFAGEYPLNSERPLARSAATWRIGRHGAILYVGCRFQDRDVQVFSGRTGENGKPAIYEGDSLEIFIQPNPENRIYYEFLVNPAGELQVLQHAASNLWKWIPLDLEVKSGAAVGAARTVDGYAVELAIPLSVFHGTWCRQEPLPGERIHFIFVRTNRDGNDYSKSCPVPLLYDGHNTFGYIRGVFR